MSAQECTAALKIQDAWREWQKSRPLCTCTTTFYPDGDKMIPEKHVCLLCYVRKERAALKIQDAWREYQKIKDSCPICLQNIGIYSCKTKCGHLFCTECLLKAAQRNNSCPMCRGELIKSDNDDDDDMHEVHEMGWSMFDGDELDASHYHQNLTDYEQGYEDAVRESFDASSSYQHGYAEGIERGKEEAGRDFERRLQGEINLAKKQAYDDGVIQGSSLADDVIRSLREEIERLKRSNSRLREDLQFATQPTRKL
mgnify:CR=1 FL=1